MPSGRSADRRKVFVGIDIYEGITRRLAPAGIPVPREDARG